MWASCPVAPALRGQGDGVRGFSPHAIQGGPALFTILTSGGFARSPEQARLILQCTISMTLAYSVAIAMFPMLRSVSRGRRMIGVIFCLTIMLCPLIVQADKVVPRALLCVVYADLGFKLVDYARQFGHFDKSNPGGFREYCRFLIPFPLFLVVFQQWQRMRRRTADRSGQILRIVLGVLLFSLCRALLKIVCQVTSLRDNFVLEHVAHLMIFVVAIESLSQVGCGIERSCGFDTSPIIRYEFLSRTIGEFWQRYNTRVHNWLMANIFVISSKKRSPALCIWVTFVISGIQHELGFGIATSRFDGYQFAFSALQAPGVLISHALDRQLARFGNTGKAASHVFTILWFAVTSPLFFHGVNRAFPFYCSMRG